jgi:hypothetical protein
VSQFRMRFAAVLFLLSAAIASCDSAEQNKSSASTPTTTAVPSSTSPANSRTADPLTKRILVDTPLTQAFTTKLFEPKFSARFPADWTIVERDAAAFQAYAGQEEAELTVDHTYTTKESVGEGVARLAKTPGLNPGPTSEITVGGRKGRVFTGATPLGPATSFTDSGFHTRGNNEGIGIIVLPAGDGTTVTVFLVAETDRQHGLVPLMKLARRILATLAWQT